MLFVCRECGFGSASWMGKCPECGKWNTLVERDFDKETGSGKKSKEKTKKLSIVSFAQIESSKKTRLPSGIFEFDRVLGGGFVPGTVCLLTGEPGVGKSTLLLQALKNSKTVYISGEESADQVKDRANRIGIDLSNLSFSDTLQVEGIVEGLEQMKDAIDIVVVDSIQTVYSKRTESQPGSVSQLKESTAQLATFAKKHKIPIVLVGHITKAGDIAGPKTLEHMVDCVLAFEGETVSQFRILRATKNRFGSTSEIGIFEMIKHGLREVKNPLAFLKKDEEPAPGRAIVGVAEGQRPLFYEIQALTVPSKLPAPRRVAKGIDYNKMLLLIAVIRKTLKVPLDTVDVYINVAGGVSIKSPACDLGIIAALLSSIKNVSLRDNTIFLGEVGLLGEVRTVPLVDKIISEGRRLRFSKIYSPKNISNIKELRTIISP